MKDIIQAVIINKGAKLTAAVFIAALLAVIPLCRPAHAADWSNGQFSCDLNVTELGQWWVPWTWGKWREFTAKFYLNAAPESSVTIRCMDTSVDGDGFSCTTKSGAPYDSKRLSWQPSIIQFTFKPGTSKSQACEDIFKGFGIKKKSGQYHHGVL